MQRRGFARQPREHILGRKPPHLRGRDVDRGQPGRHRLGDRQIVEPDQRQRPRHRNAPGHGGEQRTQRQHVVAADKRRRPRGLPPKRGQAVRSPRQRIGALDDAGRRQPGLGQRRAQTRDPPGGAIVARRNPRDHPVPAMPQPQKMRHRQPRRRRIVEPHRGMRAVRREHALIDERDRAPSQKLVKLREMRGAHEDQPVRPAREKPARQMELALGIVQGGTDEQRVACRLQPRRDRRGAAGKNIGFDRGQQRGDDLAAPRRQPPRRRVRVIIQRARRRLNPRAQPRADLFGRVQCPRHAGDRHRGKPGHVMHGGFPPGPVPWRTRRWRLRAPRPTGP